MLERILPSLRIERWKWNKEYQVYVSNFGHFKDKYKRPLAIKIDQNGYCKVKTYYNFQSCHRLVMKTWRPTGNMDNLTVDHLDHNKRNNSIYNLEWVTFEENQKRALNDLVPNKPIISVGSKNYIICKTLHLKFESISDSVDFFNNNTDLKLNKSNLQKHISKKEDYIGLSWGVGDDNQCVLMTKDNILKDPFFGHKITSKKLGTFNSFDDLCNALMNKNPKDNIDKTILQNKIIKKLPYFGYKFTIID